MRKIGFFVHLTGEKWLPVKTNQYVKWIHEHLTKSCTNIPWERHSEIYEEAQLLLLKFQDLMDEGEISHIQPWIAAKLILTSHLLTKNHKDPNEAGNYPTRLLISPSSSLKYNTRPSKLS